MEHQSLEANFFQHVFLGFAEDGTGFRIGEAAIMDGFMESAQKEEEEDSLRKTPFWDFISDLDIDLPQQLNRKMVVVHYPDLVTDIKIVNPADFNLSIFPKEQASDIRDLLSVYSILTNASQKIKLDNPQGHLVVNLVDNSFRWLFARNLFTNLDMGGDLSVLETPTANARDVQMQNALVEEVIALKSKKNPR